MQPQGVYRSRCSSGRPCPGLELLWACLSKPGRREDSEGQPFSTWLTLPRKELSTSVRERSTLGPRK